MKQVSQVSGSTMGPIPWESQLETGRLVCPRSHSRLRISADKKELQATDGATRYPLIGGRVPMLHHDPEEIAKYLAGSAMVREYQSTSSESAQISRKSGFKRRMDGILEKNFRSDASNAAFAAAFPLGQGHLFLSIGGGPQRDHPAFVNLNLGPFPNVDIIADAHRLPYADSSVDGIYCSAVMEHLYDPPRAVAEMLRVLKPGAVAYVRTPFLQPYHGYPHHYQNFTLTGHMRIFTAAGFRIEDSGTDVGPTFTVIHMIQTYVQTYFPGIWIKPVRWAWALLGHGLLKPLDRRLNARTSSHEMASTTYLLARKSK